MKEVLSRCGFKCYAEKELPEKSKRGEYNYLLVIHYKNGKKTIKIGTTNNMTRRMYEHLGAYRADITVCWISPYFSKYTTLRVEDNFKDKMINEGYHWIMNDRFEVPREMETVTVKVRKEYIINISY